MSTLPRLQFSDTSRDTANGDSGSTTPSPARGKEMRQNLLSKLRAPPLVHSWVFWHDRQNRSTSSNSSAGQGQSHQEQQAHSQPQGETKTVRYEDRLVQLSAISDVRAFWSTFNNFDVQALPLRDSIHLFHKDVKPIWEDPRNIRGGAWTFRVPKEKAPEFWKEVCMLAIGEQLQAAVASDRTRFRDDICGVSLSVRFTSTLIQVWNRDGEHEDAVRRILQTVVQSLPDELKPKDSGCYYKRHSEHAGFNALTNSSQAAGALQPGTQRGGASAGLTRSKDLGDTEATTLPPDTAASMRGDVSEAVINAKSSDSEVKAKLAVPEMRCTIDEGHASTGDAETVQHVDETLEAMSDAMNKVGRDHARPR